MHAGTLDTQMAKTLVTRNTPLLFYVYGGSAKDATKRRSPALSPKKLCCNVLDTRGLREGTGVPFATLTIGFDLPFMTSGVCLLLPVKLPGLLAIRGVRGALLYCGRIAACRYSKS